MRKLLLSSVFGPFGVDDAYGRKENRMELMHNQVTREQGIFSLRFHHPSFGLHFLAENVEIPTTVLDFPTEDEFRQEVARGYDFVGLSFILPNFDKARRMAQIVREVSPASQIVLGGHGTSIPGIADRIDCDHVCRGEGVGFLRRLLGEDPTRPIRHPVVVSSCNRQVLGVPVPDGAAVLVPGVGCANRCRFCATSHFFDGYTAYLPTGRAIFDVCCEAEARLGVTDFGVLDENFLKQPARARELVACLEQAHKPFTFGIFSSAETLVGLGDLDLLVRLGVTFLWIGVESQQEIYAKNQQVDFRALVAALRRRGIAVMASAILFLEHHDRTSLWEDVDFAIGLRPDFLQFMQLGPLPGTALYADYEGQGKLLPDVPYAERHGQDRIWFAHPHFSREETRSVLREAFDRDYRTNGPSLLRNMQTNLWGLRYVTGHPDPRVRARTAVWRAACVRVRPLLRAAALCAENAATRALVAELRAEYRALLGPPTARERLLAAAVCGYAAREKLRCRLHGDARQPPVIRTTYRQPPAREADRVPALMRPLVARPLVAAPPTHSA
ncbi:MAG: radical SAM protein [Myxococcota bacterium]|nr:radical SAM protein [Myxococcota bacterium]